MVSPVFRRAAGQQLYDGDGSVGTLTSPPFTIGAIHHVLRRGGGLRGGPASICGGGRIVGPTARTPAGRFRAAGSATLGLSGMIDKVPDQSSISSRGLGHITGTFRPDDERTADAGKGCGSTSGTLNLPVRTGPPKRRMRRSSAAGRASSRSSWQSVCRILGVLDLTRSRQKRDRGRGARPAAGLSNPQADEILGGEPLPRGVAPQFHSRPGGLEQRLQRLVFHNGSGTCIPAQSVRRAVGKHALGHAVSED
jgi:hypothetical protein